jgi:predicted DNA-binding protein
LSTTLWSCTLTSMAADRLLKFRATTELDDRVKRAAEELRRTKSDLLRIIVEDWLTANRY